MANKPKKTHQAGAAPARSQPSHPAQDAKAQEPFRGRLAILDDFLPIELAQAMRDDIDAHFAEPDKHAADRHQVWNYWYVPELYTYLRTQPEKVVRRELAEEFRSRLQAFCARNLGLSDVSWPYLSLYVPGCRQSLHNDAMNGRFGFVYSLTKNERRTIGGETIIHHEGDPFRRQLIQPAAGRAYYDSVAPRFNRLILFDDRIPHAVESVEGSMDPTEGRFVLHGHIKEGGAIVSGALPGDVVLKEVSTAIDDTFKPTTGSTGVRHGPMSFRIDISHTGVVESRRILLDRVVVSNPRDWEALTNGLLERLGRLKFPAADAPTHLIMPIMFGVRPLEERPKAN